MGEAAPAAVIDLGSNSVRLLVARREGETRRTTITALRRGAGEDGSVTDEALERLDACLADYADDIGDVPRARRLVIATSATRDAPNRARVGEIVAARIGPLRVLTGDEEARLAFSGASGTLGPGDRCVLVDIGGGSTELVRGDDGGVVHAISVRLGSVRGTDRWLVSDPPEATELAGLADEAREVLAPAIATVGGPVGPDARLIGVAGTITSLAAIALGGYDPDRVHGAILTRDRIAGLVGELAALTRAERERVPGLQPARAPAIVAGAVICAEVMGLLGAESLQVSERDILDGALALLREELGDGTTRIPTR